MEPIMFKEQLTNVSRFYQWIPSVTSVLQVIKDPEFIKILIEQKGQAAWDELMEKACLRWTELHYFVEQYFKDKVQAYPFNSSETLPPLEKEKRSTWSIWSDPKYQKYLQGVYTFIWAYESRMKVIALELPVHSLELWTAGTMDMVCFIDDVLTIIDWKTCSTAKFDNDKTLKHTLQMSAYKQLWDYYNPWNKIIQGIVVNFTDKRNSWLWEPIILNEEEMNAWWETFCYVKNMFNSIAPAEAIVPFRTY